MNTSSSSFTLDQSGLGLAHYIWTDAVVRPDNLHVLILINLIKDVLSKNLYASLIGNDGSSNIKRIVRIEDLNELINAANIHRTNIGLVGNIPTQQLY